MYSIYNEQSQGCTYLGKLNCSLQSPPDTAISAARAVPMPSSVLEEGGMHGLKGR